jgi:tRNA(Ile)-lysidine synthase
LRAGAPSTPQSASLRRALGDAEPDPGGRCAWSSGCPATATRCAARRRRPLAADIGVVASAVHVHHGLSPHADAWAAFCATACAARSLPLVQARVAIAREPGRSLEAAARAARYAAFATLGVDAVALAHHADDQAETLLLQLLRGAGPAGLAAMPAQRAPRRSRDRRPLLAFPRNWNSSPRHDRGTRWIDDKSNADRLHHRATFGVVLRNRVGFRAARDAGPRRGHQAGRHG